jgi:hypothetical protein
MMDFIEKNRNGALSAAAATYGSKSGRIRFGSQIGRYFDNQ